MESAIFPAFEIIFIYYFTSLYALNTAVIFFAGIIIDQAYSMPLGMNSLVFLLVHIIFKLAARFFPPKHYLTNFIIFCFYCFLIINFRYLLITAKKLQSDSYLVILFQYLTTIFSYSLIRVLLDSPSEYFRKNAKHKNIT
jgi:cell shape-determining protein MreD